MPEDKAMSYAVMMSWPHFHAMQSPKPCTNQSLMSIFSQVINGTLYEYWPRWEAQRAEWVAKAWDLFFGNAGLGPMPPKIRAATTAEFFVTRDRIRRRGRKFYLHAIHWIIEAEKSGHFNSWQLGVIFELLWHYIFGEPAYMQGPTLQPCELYHCKEAAVASE